MIAAVLPSLAAGRPGAARRGDKKHQKLSLPRPPAAATAAHGTAPPCSARGGIGVKLARSWGSRRCSSAPGGSAGAGAGSNVVHMEMVDFRRELPLVEGVLVIRPILEAEVPSCCALLAETFADALGGSKVYKPFLQKQIDGYLRQRLTSIPDAVTLVALFYPDHERARVAATRAREGGVEGGGELAQLASEEGEEGELVGTVEMSFSEETRSSFATLNPPTDCAYLCNMAVLPTMRRMGVGRGLLAAGEAVAELAGLGEVFLHVRMCDKPAQRLYEEGGYRTTQKDSYLVHFLGTQRRSLLKKIL